MSELSYARARLREALEDVLRLESEERIRRAYEHGHKAGYKAGIEVADKTVDSVSYRRGYLTGYAAGKRLTECRPDGTAPGGRPRSRVIA